MSDIERAREQLDRERAKAERRTSIARELILAFRAQRQANNWRLTVEQIVRGSR